MVLACKRWRPFLLADSRFRVQLHTDHKGLIYVARCSDVNSRLWRWMNELDQYQYDIEYIKGSDNTLPDSLSRLTLLIHATVDMINAPRPTPVMPVTTSPPPPPASPIHTIDRLVARLYHPNTNSAMWFRVRWKDHPPASDAIERGAALRQDVGRRTMRRLRATRRGPWRYSNRPTATACRIRRIHNHHHHHASGAPPYTTNTNVKFIRQHDVGIVFIIIATFTPSSSSTAPQLPGHRCPRGLRTRAPRGNVSPRPAANNAPAAKPHSRRHRQTATSRRHAPRRLGRHQVARQTTQTSRVHHPQRAADPQLYAHQRPTRRALIGNHRPATITSERSTRGHTRRCSVVTRPWL